MRDVNLSSYTVNSFAFAASESGFLAKRPKMFLAGVTPASEAAPSSERRSIFAELHLSSLSDDLLRMAITPALIVGRNLRPIKVISDVAVVCADGHIRIYFPSAIMVWDANACCSKKWRA